MNTDNSNSCCSCSGAFLPIVLIAASIVVFFTWQVLTLSGQKTAAINARQQLEDAMTKSTPQHEQMIQQSQAVQAKLQKLGIDLLDLAATGDADAKAIVEKHKLSRTPAATPTPDSSKPAK